MTRPYRHDEYGHETFAEMLFDESHVPPPSANPSRVQEVDHDCPIDGRGSAQYMTTIDLRSASFSDHTVLPARFAKDNDDLSPPLEWDDVPEGTAELMVSCLDPDAPAGTWVHWLISGIEPDVHSIDEGKPPPGSIEGMNSYGDVGYGGAQPPIGDPPHRYFFRVHALSRLSNLATGFSRDDFDRALQSEIATGTLVGTYQR